MTKSDTVSLSEKRIGKFRELLKQFCRKRQTFKDNIRVDMGHITRRAGETNNDVRRAIDSMHIAAVVIGGKANYRSSNSGSPIEIALEGKFTNFEVTNWDTLSTTIHPFVCVKVIIREKTKGKKHLVVTVYPDNTIDPTNIPEVDYDIW